MGEGSVHWLAEGLILLAGMGIGATSIGGVAVVPVLSGIGGVPLSEAIAASSFAFLPTGLLGWYAVRRQGMLLRTPWELHIAALLGSVVGAVMVHAVPPGAVRVGLMLLTAGSGMYGLASANAVSGRPMPSPSVQGALGLAVGCASALSGTGGPVLFLPLLMLWRAPTVPAISAAMAIQLPIAVATSSAHLLSGRLPVILGLQISAILLAGAWMGRWLTQRVPARTLRVGTSWALIGVGAWYGLST